MILTKQLQVVIESSLAQGRDYEDIRDILLKQGFQDADISDLFSQYRSTATPTPMTTVVEAPKYSHPYSRDFEKPQVRPDFVPVGFEKKPESSSAQSSLEGDIQKFMNVGTNTQTAKDILLKPESQAQVRTIPTPAPISEPVFKPVSEVVPNVSGEPKIDLQADSQIEQEIKTQVGSDFASNVSTPAQNLPAPGTVPLPSELENQTAQATTAHTTPKVLDEQGLAQGEVVQQVQQDFVPTKVQAQQYINVGFGGMPEMEKVMSEERAKNIEKSPWPLVFVLIILLGLIGGFLYWFYMLNQPSGEVTESEMLLQELQNQNQQQEQTPAPQPTGPIDPFTGLPVEG